MTAEELMANAKGLLEEAEVELADAPNKEDEDGIVAEYLTDMDLLASEWYNRVQEESG